MGISATLSAADKPVRILLLGDICLAGDYATLLKSQPAGYLWRHVAPLFQSCDLVLGNLECVFSGAGRPTTNKICLSAPANLVHQLRGISGLCLSNNHIGDLGIAGVEHTRRLLQEEGIWFWGVGDTIAVARRPLIVPVQGLRIGLLAYTCLTTNADFYATSDRPGVAPLSGKYGEEDIAALRKQCDYLIVSVHWGIEGAHFPTLDQVSLAHSMVDAGADVVWGHHAHVIQPVELYRDQIIGYSMGNLVFSDVDYEVNANLREGGLVTRRLEQQPRNRESIGLEIALDRAGGCAVLQNTHAFQTAEDGCPVETEEASLTAPYQEICKRLGRLVKRNSGPISRVREPLMSLRFNGDRHAVVYSLPPIDRWAANRQLLYRCYRAVRCPAAFLYKCCRLLWHRLLGRQASQSSQAGVCKARN